MHQAQEDIYNIPYIYRGLPFALGHTCHPNMAVVMVQQQFITVNVQTRANPITCPAKKWPHTSNNILLIAPGATGVIHFASFNSKEEGK